MAAETIQRPGEKFTPPVKESLRGGQDRALPMPSRPNPEQRMVDERVRFAFEDELPPVEDFDPYEEFVIYWEPFQPGIELQPYARMQPIASSNAGQWIARCKVEEDAIRDYLAPKCGGNPDRLKLTAADKLDMRNPELRTDCGTCKFQTTSNYAWNVHKAAWKHQ